MRYLKAAAVALMIALGGASCGGDDNSIGDRAATPRPQLVDMTAKDFSFVPAKLSGTVGAAIEVTLKNTGRVPHTFTIDEFNVDVEVAAGERTTVTVLPSEPGEFNYYCRFHKDRGMLGAIMATGKDVPGAGAPSPSDSPAADTDDYGY